jgi:uncharacterized protein
MKESRYNTILDIDDEKSLLYNTQTRKYLVFDNSEKLLAKNLLKNLNRDKFELKEAEHIKEMIKIGAVVADELDEINKLNFLYNKQKFQQDTVTLVIQTTLNCNFRCVYCYEDHKNEKLTDEVSTKIINLVKDKCKKARKLKIAWFGGEPMLEFHRIVKLTEKFKEICSENNCEYEANMTSNGYLFNDENISMLNDLGIKNIQITLDGTKHYHDKKRPLLNGEGTFKKVIDNFIKLLEKNINLNLRINVDESNYLSISDLFDIIPEKYRNGVNIQIINVFQNKKSLECYDLYKSAIDKGYPYIDKTNTLLKCEAGSPNSVTIDPKGNLTFCSMAGEEGLTFGYMNNTGNIKFTDQSLYFNFHNASPFKDKACTECIELPMCMAGCKFAKFKNPNMCVVKAKGGMSLEERIKLHYYSDVKASKGAHYEHKAIKTKRFFTIDTRYTGI